MSFYEWWGESVDPGKVGKVGLATEHEACTCRPLVIARFLFVVIAVPVAWCLIVPYVPLPTVQAAVLVAGITLIYVAASYFIDPQPDTDNVGWAGGLIDHPWRYSDDLNRLLVMFRVLLGPGRFVAESILDAMAPSETESQSEEDTIGAPQDFGREYHDLRHRDP